MKKRIIGLIIFICLFVLSLTIFIHIFSYKHADGIGSMRNYYKCRENSVDVVFFGTSHMYNGTNTQILWDDYGIASYNLCGSIQPLWNTYYYVNEALKSQTPKLLVVDCYSIIQNGDEIGPAKYIKNTYGMKPSVDKLKAVLTCFKEEKISDYILEYPTYHSRYSELTEEDFRINMGHAYFKDWKGYTINDVFAPQKRNDFSDNIGSCDLYPRCEEYMRKIIELAKEKDTPLMLVVLPYSVSKEDMLQYNRVSEIASEYDVPFINFNYCYDDIGLDFDNDLGDYAHLNYVGSEKFTKYFGTILCNEYNIPNHKGDEDYKSYDVMAANTVREIQNCKIRKENDVAVVKEMLNPNDYISIWIDETTNPQTVLIEGLGAPISFDYWTDFRLIEDIGKYRTLSIINNPEKGFSLKINREKYVPDDEGISLLVYDKNNEEVVDFRQ